jgi:hypothetical protein
MTNSIQLTKERLRRLVWTTTFATLSLVLLFISFRVNSALASSPVQTFQGGRNSVALQGTGTPTPTLELGATSTFSFSLAFLGYAETTLSSSSTNARFSFRLPENWLIQTDGLLDLDLSYIYSQLDGGNFPSQFGNLTVKLDDQILGIYTVQERELNHFHLRLPLPLALLATSNQTQHLLSVELDAQLLCDLPHEAALVIHPTSFISVNHTQHPLILDLSRYPQPFYQQSFLPDKVNFVLNSPLTRRNLADTLAVAAKLGDLSNNRLVISATTDLDITQRLSSSSTPFDENLIIVGQPQHNRLIPWLDSITELPVSLHQRQMELVSQSPITVVPGDTFTYTFTITNTTDQVADLSLITHRPLQAQLTNCTPRCLESTTGDNAIQWNFRQLSPNKSLILLLTLKASETLTGVVEQTITLTEAKLGPVNAATLTSTVASVSSEKNLKVSTVGQDGYFFVYNGQAVAYDDGIVQEIASPWSENRAILMITGLNDEAVRKASQAMSSETRFPGMRGAAAIVQDALSPAELSEVASRQEAFTLADLGYRDETIKGEFEAQLDYFFTVPYGWQLTDAATIDLYFNHSQLINYKDSGLTVSINRNPIGSVALSDETSNNGHLQISLAGDPIQTGEPNRLTIQVTMSLDDQCAKPNPNALWLVVKKSSKISLAPNDINNLRLDLEDFPNPFQANLTLSNLLFALPSAPTVDDAEMALQLAASLGSSARGKTIVPAAMLGNDLPAEGLEEYQIIAIGRPTLQPLIQQVNAQLPQPFLSGSDEIDQRLDDVIFRLSPNIDLGYIQLIPSPWNEERAFLAATGTSDSGVERAVRTLVINPSNLRGNLALVTADGLNSIDTRELTSDGVAVLIATAVPEMTPVTSLTAATASPTPTPDLAPASSTTQNTSSGQPITTPSLPSWLAPLVGLNGLLVITIFVFIYWRTRQERV